LISSSLVEFADVPEITLILMLLAVSYISIVRKNRTTENTTKNLPLITTKPYIEDDALVKIKAAAEMHPYKFIIVWKGKNGWEKREIN